MSAKKTKTRNWEENGCGKAPYRFLSIKDTAAGANENGMVRIESNDGLERWTTPGGTCAVCGNAITVLYMFVSSDGVRFHVGCECAEQAALPDRVLSAVKSEKNKRAKKLRDISDAKKIKELDVIISENDFSGFPHPLKWRAEKGETYSDYVKWMRANCGKSGLKRLLKEIKKIIE